MNLTAEYIQKEQLFGREDTILVALSGGADSVALLRILLEEGYHCIAAHCNFHLRGEESDRDEKFVRSLCKRLNVKLHTVDFDTEGYAAEQKISIEMAARELRYNWFEDIRVTSGADYIATAHHTDDSVETVLLNLIRGTGLNGLKGISPKNGKIVRPLLCLQRSDILRYLEEIGQPYVTDSTNLQDEYTRNKIRLHLLPLMEEINPSVKSTIFETSQRLRGAYSIYMQAISEAEKRITENGNIHIKKLLQEPSPETVLYELLYPKGFNSQQVSDIMQSLGGQPGKRFIAEDWEVVKDRELLLIHKIGETEKPRLVYSETEITDSFVIPKSSRYACLDRDKVKKPLTLRLCREGDWFIPFGMKGRKLLSNYMTDRKFSLLQKEQQWVLCCGEDIVWAVGERIDNRYALTAESKNAMIVRME